MSRAGSTLRFILCTALLSLSCEVAEALTESTTGRFDSILALRTTSPQKLSSARIRFFAQEKLNFSPSLQSVLSLQHYSEGVYSNASDYPTTLRSQDFRDTRLGDTYLQVKTDHLIGRFGWQQVVWGEAFGSFYADLVNPRDLRQGVPLDPALTRISTLMANLKFVQGKFSAQGLLIPQPVFHLLPLPGADYAPPLRTLTGFPDVNVDRERDLPMSIDNLEWGFRTSQTIALFDLSVFTFNGFDRFPYYEISPDTVPAQILRLNEHHARTQSTGGSVAADIEGYLLRAEAVYISGRVLPAVEQSRIVKTQSDEFSYSLSLDLPAWGRLSPSLQVSESSLKSAANYALRDPVEQLLSTRLSMGLFESSNFQTILSYALHDQGTRAQAELMTPVSSQAELLVGTELYGGNKTSSFNQIQRANRVYVEFRVNLAR